MRWDREEARALREQGYSSVELAHKYGVAPKTIRDGLRSSTRITWAERSDQVRALFAQGLSQAEIARQLGLSPNTIRHYRWDRDGAKVAARREMLDKDAPECSAIVTLGYVDGPAVSAIGYGVTRREAVVSARQAAGRLEPLASGWPVLSVSTPRSILRDLQNNGAPRQRRRSTEGGD